MIKKYLNLPLYKKIFLTYILCWLGFLFSFSLGKLIYYLSNLFKSKKTIEITLDTIKTVGTAKYEVVSMTVSSATNNPYLDCALSYIISNFTGCLVIIFVFALFAYLAKKDNEDKKRYEKYLTILFIIAVLNPLTGIIGYKLKFTALKYVLIHGTFEFLGFAISIVLGVELANKIYPVVNKSLSKNKLFLLFILAFIFISIAGFLEPISWYLYFSG
ncbi:hypothetical protein ACPB8Q_06105 [Methanocaldococcus indicus]|uniref:hypothetical protein n=1 Tax=Methanocaldococcus indicus TaxID=213231 RepID=UPI003C6D7943